MGSDAPSWGVGGLPWAGGDSYHDGQLGASYASHIQSFRILAQTKLRLEFAPVGELGGSNATSWGNSGLTPNMMVNLENHMKVTYKVSEFHLRQKLRLEFAPVGGTCGQ